MDNFALLTMICTQPNFKSVKNFSTNQSVKNCVFIIKKKPVIMAEETNNTFNHTINCLIDNKSTDFICHKFVNKYLLIITQYEKITNFFTVQKQVLLNANSHNSLIVNNNFGTDTDEIKAGIMFLLNDAEVWNAEGSSIQISIGLKNINRNILLEVKKVLKQFDL